MRLNLTECIADCSLLRDLAAHDSMLDFVKDIINDENEFKALDVRIKFGGQSYTLRSSGELADNAQQILAKLRQQPKEIKTIPNDWMAIVADSFERELYIDLDRDTAPFINMNQNKNDTVATSAPIRTEFGLENNKEDLL